MKLRWSVLLVCTLATLRVTAADPPIVAIAVAPEGEAVLTGSSRGVDIHVHADLIFSERFEIDFAAVHDLAFSPDGKLLAVAGGDPGERGIVQIFTWPDKKPLHRLASHTDVVFDVEWSSDGRRLVSGGLDKQVLLWSVPEERVERAFAGHSKGVTAVCLIETSSLLISAGLDQSLRVWNTTSGELVRTLDNHTAMVNDLALRVPDEGLPMVVSCSNDRTVRFWQPTIGRLVRFARLEATPLAVVWLPDQPIVAVAQSDGRIALLASETAETVRTFDVSQDRLYSLAITRAGELLAGNRTGQLSRTARD